jgi:hypothetical protein
MGLIRNIVLKITIKRILLDVTEEIESVAAILGHAYSFRESVMGYLKHNQLMAAVESKTWEGSFGKIIAMRTQTEMSSNPPLQNEKEMNVFLSLVAECVSSKGGNAANLYQAFLNESR